VGINLTFPSGEEKLRLVADHSSPNEESNPYRDSIEDEPIANK